MGGEGGSHSRGSRKELRVYSRELHVLGEAVTGLERHGCDGIENWGRSRKWEVGSKNRKNGEIRRRARAFNIPRSGAYTYRPIGRVDMTNSGTSLIHEVIRIRKRPNRMD